MFPPMSFIGKTHRSTASTKTKVCKTGLLSAYLHSSRYKRFAYVGQGGGGGSLGIPSLSFLLITIMVIISRVHIPSYILPVCFDANF
jgi:hypothetical protein